MTGIILLAAGESQRLGRPKQLLVWQGEPLLKRMARTAIEAGLGPVAVVLGAVEEPCREALKDLPVRIVVNPDWKTGMGGSIASGLNALLDQPLTGVIVMLCDQPQVDVCLLQRLESGAVDHKIVASRFDGELGPPAWFSVERFEDLLSLRGKGGAKSLMNAEPSLGWLDAPQAAADIDTPEDWQRLGGSI